MGEAASAPLLKAGLKATGTGTRVVGQVHLAAPIIYEVITLAFGMLFGLGALAAGIAMHAWQAFAIGTPLVLFFGWLSIAATRDAHGYEGYRVAFERALLDAFARE
jgi:hypothetical protein